MTSRKRMKRGTQMRRGVEESHGGGVKAGGGSAGDQDVFFGVVVLEAMASALLFFTGGAEAEMIPSGSVDVCGRREMKARWRPLRPQEFGERVCHQTPGQD